MFIGCTIFGVGTLPRLLLLEQSMLTTREMSTSCLLLILVLAKLHLFRAYPGLLLRD